MSFNTCNLTLVIVIVLSTQMLNENKVLWHTTNIIKVIL